METFNSQEIYRMLPRQNLSILLDLVTGETGRARQRQTVIERDYSKCLLSLAQNYCQNYSLHAL